MARALIAGLLRHGVPADRISVGEPSAAARSTLEHDFQVHSNPDNAAAVGGADLIVLAVKPQDTGQVLRAVHAALRERSALLLSIAAGLRIADLQRACPAGTAVMRAMPNRAALVGAGVTGLYAPPNVTAAQRLLGELLGTAVGRAVWLRAEAEIDVVTAVSGSGPAYFFLLAEQLASAGEALGLSADTAALLATATLQGAGQLTQQPGSLAEQRAAVTSRGGTTEAALQALHAGGFEALIARAVQAASARSSQLADTLGAALQTDPP